MRLIECEQGTEEWLQARCGVPSASMYSRIVTTKGKWSKSAEGYIDQLIMEKVVAEFKLEVTQEDVNQISVGYTAQMLRQYGMNNPDLETIRYFEEKNKEDKNYMRKIGDIAIDRKVTDHVKTMITVKDKKIALDAFYKMIEKHNHEHNH